METVNLVLLAQWMEAHHEWILETYSEARSEPSAYRNGEPVYFNREEALTHARLQIGARTQQGIVGVSRSLIELVDVYAEGGDEGGVIMGQWKVVKTWKAKHRSA